MLATSAITLGYTQITGNSGNITSSTAVTIPTNPLGVTVTIPAGGRKVKITAYITAVTNSSSAVGQITIWDGTVSSGTQLAQANVSAGTATTQNNGCVAIAVVTPSAGSKTYKTHRITRRASRMIPTFMLTRRILCASRTISNCSPPEARWISCGRVRRRHEQCECDRRADRRQRWFLPASDHEHECVEQCRQPSSPGRT